MEVSVIVENFKHVNTSIMYVSLDDVSYLRLRSTSVHLQPDFTPPLSLGRGCVTSASATITYIVELGKHPPELRKIGMRPFILVPYDVFLAQGRASQQPSLLNLLRTDHLSGWPLHLKVPSITTAVGKSWLELVNVLV
jgi:hypothetical protein